MAEDLIKLVEVALPNLKNRTPFSEIKEKSRLRVMLPNGKFRDGIVWGLARGRTPQGGPYLSLLTRHNSEGLRDETKTKRIYDVEYDVYIDAWGKVAMLDPRLGEGHVDYCVDPNCCWHPRDKALKEAGLP